MYSIIIGSITCYSMVNIIYHTLFEAGAHDDVVPVPGRGDAAVVPGALVLRACYSI